jgi:hypothetical protein
MVREHSRLSFEICQSLAKVVIVCSLRSLALSSDTLFAGYFLRVRYS